MKKILGTLSICLLFVLTVAAAIFQGQIFFANSAYAAENEVKKYSLVPATYNSEPDQTLEKYNIENRNLDPFTPFDFDKGQRMDGSAFNFNYSQYNQIEEQYVTVGRHEDIELDNTLALGVWIYFDGTILHNLNLKLELENGETVVWHLSAEQLMALLTKSIEGFDVNPYGYNYLVFPFIKATNNLDLSSGEMLPAVTRFYVSYTSSTESEQVSRLTFYAPAITYSASNLNIEVTKQPYSFADFTFFKNEILNSLTVNDELTLPVQSVAIKYAWIGRRNVLTDPRDISWRVQFQTPTNSKSIRLGEKIKFEEEGAYVVEYRGYETVEEKQTIVLHKAFYVNISKLNAIYFNKNALRMNVDSTFVLSLNTSKILTDVSDYSFEYDESALQVTNNGGVVEVKPLKAGTHTLKAKVSAKRAISNQSKEYETSIEITAVKQNTGTQTWVKIILYVILGLILVGFAVSLIISLVKSRKNSVK